MGWQELPDPFRVALLFAAPYFAAALLTGVWKWRAMLSHENGRAGAYVDIAHHAALHYGPFLALAGLLAVFWPLSQRVPAWWLVAVMSTTMMLSLSRYVLLGIRGGTDNQLRRPDPAARFGLVLFFCGTVLPGTAIAVGAMLTLLGAG